MQGGWPGAAWHPGRRAARHCRVDPGEGRQKKMDRFIHLALVAATEAVEDSGWLRLSPRMIAVRLGVMIGLRHRRPCRRSSRRRCSVVFQGKARRLVAILHSVVADQSWLRCRASDRRCGFKGPSQAAVTACARSVCHAIGDASRLIMWGDATTSWWPGAREAAVCRDRHCRDSAPCARCRPRPNDQPGEGVAPLGQGP